MSKPLFSCVVPVKGPRPYLDEALASLSAQGMGDDLEVIVQDGGGKFENRGLRIENGRWVCEEDCGQSDALNRGFAKAKGEWFFWLNSDDLLLSGVLERVKAKIEALAKTGKHVEWIVGNQLRIDADGRVVDCSVGNGWHDCLYRHAVPHVYGPSSFFRRELFERTGGFDVSLHICMDWDMWIRFMRSGARFHRIGAYLWAQRQWSGSKTQRKMGREELNVHQEEVARMLAKNDFRITHGGVWLSRLWRTLNGNYFAEWRDGMRMRGRKALECAD